MVRAARHDAAFAERGALRSDPMPLAQSLSEVPILGRVYTTVISGYSLPVYLAWLAVRLTAFVLARTRFGLRLWGGRREPRSRPRRRAVGRSPAFCGNRGERGIVRPRGCLPVDGPRQRFSARHECRPRLPGSRRADLRQMAPVAGARRLPVVRCWRRGAGAPAGCDPARHRYGAGAANPGAALSDHSGDTGWFRRHGAPTAGAGRPYLP